MIGDDKIYAELARTIKINYPPELQSIAEREAYKNIVLYKAYQDAKSKAMVSYLRDHPTEATITLSGCLTK